MLDSIKKFDYKILLSKSFISKILLIIFVMIALSLLLIGFMDGEKIDVKNSSRRKITEKMDKEKKNLNYFKKKNNELKDFGKKLTSKLRINQINK